MQTFLRIARHNSESGSLDFLVQRNIEVSYSWTFDAYDMLIVPEL
jgi:hypothetical protein